MTQPVRSRVMSRRDLEFLLFEWLRVEDLTERPRYNQHSRSTFEAVLDVSAQIAEQHFAPHNRSNDIHEPTLVDGRVEVNPEIRKALDAFNDSGLLAATLDEELGGLQLPETVAGACWMWLQAANAATVAYPVLTLANANLLLTYGTPEDRDDFVASMIDGRFLGTMCLSEPQAGSSLSAIRTRAVPDNDGSYRLFGQKMWISGGDHNLSENIIHLVLARVQGTSATGTRGLSLFVVPKVLTSRGYSGERNDVVCAGLNHKMGFRGTSNAVLSFGDGQYEPDGRPGAVGYLVGEEGRGLQYMFHMMNESRILVGASATALGYTGYLHALDYAKERQQGRRLGGSDDAEIPIVEHPDVKRMLLAQKSYVEGALALNLYCRMLLDEQKTATETADSAAANLLLGVLTPIVKSWPAQYCLAANDLAIQVHGGYGYTRDYPVEQFYRDNRLNPIHEGTHGIQGLDLLGRKVHQDDGAAFGVLVARMRSTIEGATAAGGTCAELAVQLDAYVERIDALTSVLRECSDQQAALANASVYLEVLGHVVIAWMWLEQVVCAHGRDGDLYDGKRAAAQYFYRYELPSLSHRIDFLAELDRTTVDMEVRWF